MTRAGTGTETEAYIGYLPLTPCALRLKEACMKKEYQRELHLASHGFTLHSKQLFASFAADSTFRTPTRNTSGLPIQPALYAYADLQG